MDINEIVEIVKIMEHADGGCVCCARSLVHQLAEQFPEHKDTIIRAFKHEWEDK